MRIIVTSLLMTALALPATLCAQQSRPELDVAVTYNPQWSNLTTGANFWTQGGGAELSAMGNHGWGLAANVTGTHATHISPSGVNLTLVTATFGPRFTLWLPHHAHSQQRIHLFGEVLVGEAHGMDSVFPSEQGAHANASSLALQMGGGADLTVAHHLAIRLVQASWLRTQLPNATTNVQNNLLFGTGIVFRFP
jgi:peptidoglycan-associated lipoprotein